MRTQTVAAFAAVFNDRVLAIRALRSVLQVLLTPTLILLTHHPRFLVPNEITCDKGVLFVGRSVISLKYVIQDKRARALL